MAAKVFNTKIKNRREELRLTQQQVANEVNITLSQYCSLEDGRTGTTASTKPHVEAVCDYLGIPFDEVYIADFRNTQVVVFGYGKGGTCKSTVTGETSFHLGVTYKKKVLVADGDFQMNVTKAYGLSPNKKRSLRALLEADFESDEFDINNYIHKTRFDNIDCIISDPSLNGIDRVLYSKPLSEAIFHNAIQEIIQRGVYDYILIDTSPHLGALTLNLMFAADKYYMPVKMEPYAMDSMHSVIETILFIKKLRKRLNEKPFEISGILRTVVDLRKNVTTQITNDLKDAMGDKVLETFIPIDTTVEKAQYEKKFTTEFDKSARSVKYFKEFAREVMK